jgi:hypothetical protein
MSNELPIKTLVSSRCEELGLKPVELVRRCGYQNTNKGLRRLEELCRGDFSSSSTLIRTLPAALDVLVEVVTRAVEDTRRQLREAQEAAWRAEFLPHAVILTERKIPQPIFVAAFIGVDRLRRVDFDLKQGPESYITQALNGVREKLARWKSDQIPTFGQPTGLVVNYTPDWAIRFDPEGNAVEVLNRAYRIGEASLSIGKRAVSSKELEAIFRQCRATTTDNNWLNAH